MLRPLKGFEAWWASEKTPEYLEFAIKLQDPKLLPRALDNLQKMFCGTRLNVVNGCYHKIDTYPVTRLPNYIQDCEKAIDWMIANNCQPFSKTCTSISHNDDIIAVSTCHNTGAGGFVVKAIKQCLDDPKKLFPNGKLPEVPTATSEIYQDMIDKAIKSNPTAYLNKDLSQFSIDLKSPHLMPPDAHGIYLRNRIPASTLQCYDQNKKRPINLSNQIWTAFSLVHEAYGAKQEGRTEIKRLSTSSVVDLNRAGFSKPIEDKIDWSCTNNVCSPNIFVNTTPDMTIEDIGKAFRINHDLNEKNGTTLWFTQGDMSLPKEGRVVNGVSNIGPVEMKNGLKDFYLQSYSPAPTSGGHIFMTSFSVVTKNRNDLITCLRYQPSIITEKTAQIIKQSTEFVLTKLPVKTALKDAVKEVQDFQTMLEEEL